MAEKGRGDPFLKGEAVNFQQQPDMRGNHDGLDKSEEETPIGPPPPNIPEDPPWPEGVEPAPPPAPNIPTPPEAWDWTNH